MTPDNLGKSWKSVRPDAARSRKSRTILTTFRPEKDTLAVAAENLKRVEEMLRQFQKHLREVNLKLERTDALLDEIDKRCTPPK